MSLFETLEQKEVTPTQRARGDRTPEYRERTRIRREKKLALPFISVDGEGGDVDSPQMALFGPNTRNHEYLLLRAGDAVLETGKPLTWFQCFDFLSSLPKEAEYVSYFFDYDVTMMIRGLTPERIYRLLRRETRPKSRDGEGYALPVDVGPFQIDYLPGKEFKVRKGDGPWTYIQDTGTFFQTSFVKTLDKWSVGTEEERKMIREGKALRAEFGTMTDEIRYYNALECKLLSELMTEFRSVCKQLGYVPSRYEGPGLLATAAFQRHKIPRSKDLEVMQNVELMHSARSAYYGGRFEIGTVGPTPPVEQWDINSAYPFAIRHLPCLLHGSWTQSDSPTSTPFLAEINYKPTGKGQAHYWGFPCRDSSGNICFPASGKGTYWSPEIVEVEEAGWQSVEYLNVWNYETSCTCKPFGWIEGVYNARKKLGKDGKGFILKLLLNSLYGKMAQSIGSPVYSNPIWAGMITSITRAILIRAIYSAKNTRDIHMLATDGIFATAGALDLPVSDNLGGWSKDLHSEMFIIQPGVYFTGEDCVTPKTRGVPQSVVVVHRDEFREAFNRVLLSLDGKEGAVPLKLPTFLGGRSCLHLDNLSMMGEWIEQTRTVTFDWSSKRRTAEFDGFYLQPMPPMEYRESKPYTKLLGVSLDVAAKGFAMEALRDALADQPDWIQLTL